MRGSKPHRTGGKDTLDWLRNQGVEILTDSKTLQKGSKAKSTDAEYYLLKDFPKRKITDKEEYALLVKGVKERKIKELESQNKLMGESFKPLFNEGGEVSNNLQNFLDIANEVIQLERREYKHGGLLNRLKRKVA